VKTVETLYQNHQLNWWYAQALEGHNTGASPLRGIEKSANRITFTGRR